MAAVDSTSQHGLFLRAVHEEKFWELELPAGVLLTATLGRKGCGALLTRRAIMQALLPVLGWPASGTFGA